MIKKLYRKLFKTPTIMSFQQGFDLTELPIVTFRQDENKYNFILDTGSSANIIDAEVVKDMVHSKIEKTSSLFGMEGKKGNCSMCTIPLSFKEDKYEGEYLIRDMKDAFGELKKTTGVTVHGIIGALFFNKYKYVLDFSELIAYSKM